jgi:hypothetical protein
MTRERECISPDGEEGCPDFFENSTETVPCSTDPCPGKFFQNLKNFKSFLSSFLLLLKI